MTKILVTGGAGYIGSHTVRHLIQRGIAPKDIVVLDNLSAGHERFVPTGVEFERGDLAEPSDVSRLFARHSPDSVIHFAGVTYVGESVTSPEKYYRNNVVAGLNLLQAMLGSSCRRIVFSSSCATYGIPLSLPIREDDAQQPVNPYGETKLIFEHALRWYGRAHGIRSVALRYFNAAGAGYDIGERHSPETHLIPLAIRAALQQGPTLMVYGSDYDTPDGTCVRDYVHVLDLAEAHIAALEWLAQADSPFTGFNLGTGQGTSVTEIVRAVSEASQQEVPIAIAPRRAGDPPVLVADPTRALEVLGWRALRDIRDIVRDACAWHVRNP